MIRWNHLFPRLVLLLAALVAFHFLKNPLARWMLVRTATLANGDCVDILSMKVSAGSGKVCIDDLQCADSRVHGNNLFQFESGDFQLSLWQALHKNWVVESATIQGVRFGTPRSDSGLLTRSVSPHGGIRPVVSLPDASRNAATTLMADLERHIPLVIESDLQSSRLIRELDERWPGNMEAAGNDAMELARLVEQIEQQLIDRDSNPLRDLRRVDQARQQTVLAKERLAESIQHAARLEQAYQQDRLALIEAQQRDLDTLAAMSRNIRLDEKMMNELLLEQHARELSALTLDWANWLHDQLHSREIRRKPAGIRGSDVVFAQRPAFMIRQLSISGDTCISGKNVGFAGTVCNLSSSPHLLESPVTFHIRGLGESHFLLAGSADFRGAEPVCEVCLTLPSVQLPPRQIGKPELIQLAVTPGQQSVVVRMKLAGDQIEARIDVETARVKMAVEQLAAAIESGDLRDSLNNRLEPVDHYSILVDLCGPISEPRMSLNSDLGSRFADLLGVSWREAMEEKILQRQRELESRFARQVAERDTRFQESAEKVARFLSQESVRLASLCESLEPPGSTANSIR